MKNVTKTLILAILCAIPVWATPIEADTASPASDIPALPEGEKRLRQGIIIIGKLTQSMAEINNKETADAAVPQIMRLCEELRQWTQAFNNLPPLSETEAIVYEDRYLPIIRKINKIMQDQADRLAAAEYYGSQNLPAALIHVAQVGH